MSKTFDIMFHDLTEEAQHRILEFKGIESPADVGWTYVPIATLVETDERDEALDNRDDMSEIPQEGEEFNDEEDWPGDSDY